jgi:hypothetical protein
MQSMDVAGFQVPLKPERQDEARALYRQPDPTRQGDKLLLHEEVAMRVPIHAVVLSVIDDRLVGRPIAGKRRESVVGVGRSHEQCAAGAHAPLKSLKELCWPTNVLKDLSADRDVKGSTRRCEIQRSTAGERDVAVLVAFARVLEGFEPNIIKSYSIATLGKAKAQGTLGAADVNNGCIGCRYLADDSLQEFE